MIQFILTHSKKILLALLVLFLALFTNITNFQLDASSDSLVLENDKDVLYYQELRKKYASDENLIISYEVTNDLLSSINLEHLKNFVADLKNVAHTGNITSILSVPLFSSPQLSITDLTGDGVSIEKGNAVISLARKEFKNSPIYGNNLVSSNGNATAILVDIDTNHTEKIIKEIREVIQKHQPHATIFLGGLPMLTHDIIEYIGSDLLVFSVLIVLIMALILLLIFRSLRFMILPLGAALIVALSMSALLGLLGWKITVISSNFFSLLLVMTLSVMIHLIVRYRELASNSTQDKNELIENTLRQMFKPCLYTTLTTLIAFVSLLISGIRPVIDFGFMMAIGVLLAFVLAFLIFATSMHLLPQMRIASVQTETKITMIFATIVDKFATPLKIVVAIIVIASVYGVSQITVENRFIDYFKKDTEIHQGLAHIDTNLGGTIPLEIIFNGLGEDYFYDSAIREDIQKVHTYLENRAELGKVLSIDTLLQVLASVNDDTRPSGFFLNIIKNQIPEYAKPYVYDPYINEDTGDIRVVVRVRETHPGLNRQQLITSIHTDLQQMGFKENSYHINGLMVLYNNMLQSLFDSQIKTIAAVFAMIWLMFLVLFRSISIATIAIIPNIIPSLLILGIMGMFNIPLDLMTITIAAIAIGIGVDNAIHYITRFTIEFNKYPDYVQSMFRAHGSIGLAMFWTSITVALGFIVLIFSNFVPSLYFGIFTAIAMFSAVVLNLTLLPYLLILFKPNIR